MAITHTFPNLNIDGVRYDFSHLSPTFYSVSGHGINGRDINVRISFKSHVFSVSLYNEVGVPDFYDENGRPRSLSIDRYERSICLPSLCKRMIFENHLTWVSKDRHTKSHLAVIEDPLVTGEHYVVFYYLFPSSLEDCDVELVIKSAYTKRINFMNVKRRYKMIQKIKECYFTKKTIP